MANGQFDDFDEALRIPVTTKDLVWDVLPTALEMGRIAERDYQEAPGLPDRKKQKRRRPEERLRAADPW